MEYTTSHLYYLGVYTRSELLENTVVRQHRGGSRRRVQRVRTPPEMTCGFLIKLVFTSGHQSVTAFFSGAPPPKKYPGSAPAMQRSMGRLGVIPSSIERHSCILLGCIFCGININSHGNY